MFYCNPETGRRIRFHDGAIGTNCPWRDVVRPLMYMAFKDDMFRSRAALLPELAALESASQEEWQAMLADMTRDIILSVLDVAESLFT